MSKRFKPSQAHAAIQASLQIALERALLIELIIDHNPVSAPEKLVTELELINLRVPTDVAQ